MTAKAGEAKESATKGTRKHLMAIFGTAVCKSTATEAEGPAEIANCHSKKINSQNPPSISLKSGVIWSHEAWRILLPPRLCRLEQTTFDGRCVIIPLLVPRAAGEAPVDVADALPEIR